MKIKSEKGSVVVLALIFVVVLGIMLGSLIIVPSAISGSTRNRNALQAFYAAEAGAKRAIAACKIKNSNWTSWLGTEVRLIDGDEFTRYKVNIKDKTTSTVPDWVTQNKVPKSGNYIITSQGQTKNSKTTVECEIDISGKETVSLPKAGVFVKEEIEVTGPNKIPAHNDAQDKNLPAIACGSNKVSDKFIVDNPNKIQLNYDDDDIQPIKVEAYSDQRDIPKLVQNGNYLNEEMYYHDGDLEITTQNIDLYGKPSVIFIHGNLTINAKMNIKNVMFIVDGNVTLGPQANNTNFVKSVIYSNKNMIINAGGIDLNGGSNLIIHGKLSIKGGVNNFNGNSDTNIDFEDILNKAANNSNSMTVSVEKWKK